MLQFTATIHKFDKKGEKTGWTYIEINASQAAKLKPENKVSFRVKGTLDQYTFEKVALLPMGDGNFILPLNGTMRKAIGKKQGDKVKVVMEKDDRKMTISHDLVACLKEDPDALKFFKSLPGSHQLYFSKWIESAKTAQTKTKRIVTAMVAFSKKQGYAEMMRAYRGQNG
jgi:Domain of unknown function (DUF1905)/Bacteriocin-protection, YdeI or OmpD-Associated